MNLSISLGNLWRVWLDGSNSMRLALRELGARSPRGAIAAAGGSLNTRIRRLIGRPHSLGNDELALALTASGVILTLVLGAYSAAAVVADEGPATQQATKAVSGPTVRTVAGRVVDSQGKPVAGAQVWWYVQRRPGFSVRGRTDGGGRFRLSTPSAWVPVEDIRRADVVWALGPTNDIAAARALKGLVDSEESRDLVLQLNPAKETNFQIVSRPGKPMEGATVEPASYRGGRGIDLIPDPIREVLRGTTDPAGRVRMHIGTPDFFNIRVTSERFGIQLLRLNSRDSTTERTFELSDVGRIEGRVIAKDPKDALGVRIHFQSVTAMTEGVADVVTDERGNFVVPKIAGGVVHVTHGSADASSPVRLRLPEGFSLERGQTAHLEIPVERLMIVRGSVQTEESHAPVVGAKLTVAFGNGIQGTPAVCHRRQWAFRGSGPARFGQLAGNRFAPKDDCGGLRAGGRALE